MPAQVKNRTSIKKLKDRHLKGRRVRRKKIAKKAKKKLTKRKFYALTLLLVTI